MGNSQIKLLNEPQTLTIDTLHQKLAKRVQECQSRGISEIYIYFGQPSSSYQDPTVSQRIYYSRQNVDPDEVASFISLYSGEDLSLSFHQNYGITFLFIGLTGPHHRVGTRPMAVPGNEQESERKTVSGESEEEFHLFQDGDEAMTEVLGAAPLKVLPSAP
jgi:hypothetical protein